jgi:NAD(P)-dependent dehydrogenase (short-subunit alcohol dehydrogenase family)
MAAGPLKFWEISPYQWRRFVAVHTMVSSALTNAVAIRDDAPRLGPDYQCSGEPWHDDAGCLTYGPSKAVLAALSAIMANDLDGTGVTVNGLVTSRATNTPMISDEACLERVKLIQPEVMVPPLLWLICDTAGKVTGRRFLGIHWDPALAPGQAAEKAGASVAWTRIVTIPITPSRS